MYKNLPQKLFKHPHTKGLSIRGYSDTQLILFTSKQKAKQYKKTDASLFVEEMGGVYETGSTAYEKLTLEELKSKLQEIVEGGPHNGFYDAVVFNVCNVREQDKGHNEFKYDAIYSADELLKLLNNDPSFSSAKDYSDDQFKDLLDQYSFQTELTAKLDGYQHSDFSQEIINEIVLWKVNRYVSTNSGSNWLSMLNSFKNDKEVNEEKLSEFLNKVLETDLKGIRLAMASTFLRFRNPAVYQIIDERTFRVVMRDHSSGKEKIASFTSTKGQIQLYIEYLKKLKTLCTMKGIDFKDADRILYQFDKVKNGDFNSLVSESNM